MGRIVHRLRQFSIFLLIAAALWSAWYVSHRGFTRKWRNQIIREFRSRGVEISFNRLTLDPFRGLMARDVRIVGQKDRGAVLATIGSVVLDINYANLIQGESFLNAIDLRQTNLSLPMEGAQRLVLANLDAKLVMAPQQMHLHHAEADFYGVHLKASGHLINPEAQDKSSRLDLPWLQDLVSVLKKIKTQGAPPQLEVRFSGDLADPTSIYAEATLSAQAFSYEGFKGCDLIGNLIYKDRTLEIKRLGLGDGRGRLDLGGRCVLSTGLTQLQLRSTLDPQPLGCFFPWLSHCKFQSLPSIDCSTNGSIKDGSLQLVGQVALEKFSVNSAEFDRFATGFSWKQADWYLSKLQILRGNSKFEADLLKHEGRWRARVQSDLAPDFLSPFLPADLAKELQNCRFHENPKIRFNCEGIGAQAVGGEGELILGRTLYRSTPLTSLTTQLLIKENQLVFENLRISRAEGNATGRLRLDLGTRELYFDRVESNLWPEQVATWISPELARWLAPYRFKVPPQISVQGKVPIANPQKLDLELKVKAPSMDYAFFGKNISAVSPSALLLFAGGSLKLSDLKAQVFDGQIQLDATFPLGPGPYKTALKVQDLDFPALTKHFFRYDPSGGKLSGSFNFSGKGKESLKGEGKIEVLNGDLFTFPLFGQLLDIFENILPKAGLGRANKGSASFQVEDGFIKTNELLIQGLGYAMIGDGRLNYLQDKIDFNLRLNARGAPGLVLLPVSKLLEFKAEGSLSEPKWKPKRL